MTPPFTVILSTDGPPEAIARALHIVASQMAVAWELILVGPDNPEAVLERAGLSHLPVRSVSCTTRFPGRQWNAGIRIARGDNIALLDSATEWPADFLQQAARTMNEAPDDDVFYAPVRILEASGGVLTPVESNRLPCGWVLDELFEEPWIVPTAAVFRRNVWERHGGFDETLTITTAQNFFLRIARAHRFHPISRTVVSIDREAPCSDLREQARCVRESGEMLHRFFAEQGGDERLDRNRSRRTLAEVCTLAGNLSWQSGNRAQALRGYGAAYYYYPTWRNRLRFWWHYWRSGWTEPATSPAFDPTA